MASKTTMPEGSGVDVKGEFYTIDNHPAFTMQVDYTKKDRTKVDDLPDGLAPRWVSDRKAKQWRGKGFVPVQELGFAERRLGDLTLFCTRKDIAEQHVKKHNQLVDHREKAVGRDFKGSIQNVAMKTELYETLSVRRTAPDKEEADGFFISE